VKVLVLGTSAVALIQSTTTLFVRATEPVWMLVWGVSLLVLASGAKSLLRRQDTAAATAPTAVTPRPRRAIASVKPATSWREALVAKLNG